ncbi:MAG TPA: hypothetical protein VFF73_32490, partial [Planctomycetota bacterium]|nr:hypothetical protein [Planctomycetota bacterium]
ELVATSAPPVPINEPVLVELRPSPRHVWVYGHWAWHGHWVWIHGHWHVGRPGHVWVKGHWDLRDGRWHWRAGAWTADAQVTEESPGLLVANVAPPAPYDERIVIETRPAANYTWIHGHWAWHGHWTWIHGHWHANRPGHVWVGGHWVVRGGAYHWISGAWVTETTVAEETPGELECASEPPRPIVETEVIELRPSPSHVWIKGYWAWHGHWVWNHGYWHVGRAGHRWREGHWEHRGPHWHWVVGVWI